MSGACDVALFPTSAAPEHRPRTRRDVAALARDQATSTFTKVLERLVEMTPGALGAALVDYEGETVDYTGRVDPFELKITAAHWLVVLSETSDLPSLGRIRELTVRAKARAYHVRRLEEGYAAVLVLRPRTAFAVSQRAMDEAAARLSLEAGWPANRELGRWAWVEVEPDPGSRGTRPKRVRVGGNMEPVEVLGAVVGLAPREKGFRVRLQTGAELMLIRDRLGCWFTDDPIE
jgi:hypothetical protein